MASRKSTQPIAPMSTLELLNLQHTFGLAHWQVQHALTRITEYVPQSPEGEALKGIYGDILRLCLDAMREAATAHLQEELAALLAFQHAELEWRMQHRRGQQKEAPVRATTD
jgi:hypothetical protein